MQTMFIDTKNYSMLDTQDTALLVIAVLVKRLGGTVEIEQADIDDVAFQRLMETGLGDGVRFELSEPPRST